MNGTRQTEILALKPTPANLKVASKLMASVRAAIAAGVFDYTTYFPKSKFAASSTFRQAADKWISTVIADASTIRSYKLPIRRWNRLTIDEAAFGDMLLPKIKPSDCKAAVAKLAKEIKAKTLNNYMIPLRGIFDSAVGDGILEASPMAKIKNLKAQEPEPDPFDPDELAAILAFMAERYPPQVANYFELSFLTGLRPSEAIALRWPKVDWRLGTLKIDEAKVIVYKTTKTHRVRNVELTARAMACLQRQKAYTFMKGEGDFIFENPNTGDPWSDDGCQRKVWFHPALRALGMRKRAAYQTRHTYATLAIMKGLNHLYIARQLGHKNTAMLYKHYSKWIDNADGGRQRALMEAAHDSIGRDQSRDQFRAAEGNRG